MISKTLTVASLREAVDAGDIDTVVLAMVDMQGRLQGKRFDAEYFVSEVVPHGAESCTYLLAVDIVNPADGYASPPGPAATAICTDTGPERAAAHSVASGTALCWLTSLADRNRWSTATTNSAGPDRSSGRTRWQPCLATSWNFSCSSTLRVGGKDYRRLQPANHYNVDYSIFGISRVEPLIRVIRLGMRDAGMRVESSKGECNPGQYEIALKYDEAMRTCDNHVIYKNGAKEIVAQHGSAVTFMAKFDQREGSSCHIHMSLRAADGQPVFAGEQPYGFSPVFEHFLAGQLAALPEFTLFLAPTINSYKRYQSGSFAPTTLKWGIDNRTCAFRVVGHGPSLRVECRIPGADVNPYLAAAAMIAAGIHGVDNELPLEPAFDGNAYTAAADRVPTTLRDAAELWRNSALARKAFGDEVVAHYANAARVEIAAFDSAVTDWEKARNFERI
jgi:glutamine synthetase